MEDRELIRTYAIAMFMLALLDEWDKIERIGIVAKIYNTITKKHHNFHQQILQVKQGTKEKYSKKCSLFITASSYAVSVWEECIKETKEYKISANTAIHNLFRLNSENFTRIYGLSDADFKQFDNDLSRGVTFSSCKVARILSDRLQNAIDSGLSQKNIYETVA